MKTKANLKVELYGPKSRDAKAYIGDLVKINYVHRDDSKRLQARVGQVGKVLGRTNYQVPCPGNRYYVEFADGYVAGFESWLIERA